MHKGIACNYILRNITILVILEYSLINVSKKIYKAIYNYLL